VQGVLDPLGTIELPRVDAADQPTEQLAASATSGSSWRERRLYRLTGEGESMLAGVCSGLAAYLNIDVTVVRVLTVILVLATSGVALIVYVAMAIVVPEADTPGMRAAGRGYGETAQELMSRARDGAGPALASLGSLIRRFWVAIAKVVRWIFLAATWLVLAAWGIGVSWILIDGEQVRSAFDDGTSRWMVALWVTCVAWIAVSVLLGVAALVRRLTPGVDRRTPRFGAATGTAWGASVIAAFVGLWAIPFTYSTQLRDARDGQGRVTLFGQTYCFVDPANSDPPTASERCHEGDEVVDGNAQTDEALLPRGAFVDPAEPDSLAESAEPDAPAEPAEPAAPAHPA
jgi:phage shock protein PspC (stress-responsive transcriptional regulator)